jgi:hypothetical protein
MSLRHAAAALVLLAAGLGHAAEPGGLSPQPPCDGGTPVPAYASATEVITVQTWTDVQWHPPACLAWPDARYRFVIAVAGRIEAADDAVLRRRLAAVSSSKGLRYWSVTENAWRVLIKEASALSAADGVRREDFAADDIRAGAVLHFVEEDNRSSTPVVYRMQVLEATRDRIVVETQNVTPIESFMITLFPPGSLRAAYFMTRTEGSSWGFYAVSASTGAASAMVKLAKASYINRARALYGHFAGLALDAESAPAPSR